MLPWFAPLTLLVLVAIRNAQVEALAEPLVLAFVGSMVVHCARFFPGPAAELGDEGLERVIRRGIGRAWSYGFDRRRMVRAYVDLTFMLGSDFDRDPQLPWARRILTDPEIPTAGQRYGVLWSEAMHYIDAVAGPEGGQFFRALIRARRVDPMSLAGVDSGDFEAEVGRRLRALFPEKYDRLDEPARAAMLELGTTKATAHGLTGGPGRFAVLVMMLLLGSHFDVDPQFPWAQQALRGEHQQAVKIERLRREAGVHLERALAMRPTAEEG